MDFTDTPGGLLTPEQIHHGDMEARRIKPHPNASEQWMLCSFLKRDVCRIDSASIVSRASVVKNLRVGGEEYAGIVTWIKKEILSVFIREIRG